MKTRRFLLFLAAWSTLALSPFARAKEKNLEETQRTVRALLMYEATRGRLKKDRGIRFGDFSKQNLRGVHANGLNLQKFNFRNADLRGADLTGTNLRNADFCGADLSEAVLVSANERGAKYCEKTKFPFRNEEASYRGWVFKSKLNKK